MSIEFYEVVTKKCVDELDKLLKEQYDLEPNEVYCNENHLFEQLPYGGSMWPKIVELNSKSSDDIIEMLNKLSLRDYETSLIGTEAEHLIGTEECYDRWGESNCHHYNEGGDSESYFHENVLDDVRFAIKRVEVDE